jgi:predicted membrane protein
MQLVVIINDVFWAIICGAIVTYFTYKIPSDKAKKSYILFNYALWGSILLIKFNLENIIFISGCAFFHILFYEMIKRYHIKKKENMK